MCLKALDVSGGKLRRLELQVIFFNFILIKIRI